MTTATETLPLAPADDREQLLAAWHGRDTERIKTPPPSRPGSLECLHFDCRSAVVAREIALAGHHLAFADTDGAEYLLEIGPRLLHIGRSRAAEIRLEDLYVSRRHAIIIRRGDSVRLLDDGSTGGTFVNGVSIVATNLSDGDVIRIGAVIMRYVVVR